MFLQQVRMMKLRYLSTTRTFLLVVLTLFSGLMSCESSQYEQLIETEYNSGIRNDSLLLGIYFGDSRKEFFAHGWDLNKQGLVRQGRGNNNVSHLLKSEDDKTDIEMLFYPDFDQELKIKSIPIRFMYTGWAPWNEQLFADSLLYAVKDTLLSWYGGNSFYLLENENPKKNIWYKVDGNRQITLAVVDEKQVKVMIKDMYHPDNDPFN